MTRPNVPDDCVEVVVEIPRGSRNKYEMDHETGVIRLDRRLFSATMYPADYGFIPDTLAEDGDALDALVLLEDPTFPGCHVTARPVGMLTMEDEKGRDVKIISVPPHEPRFAEVLELDDLQDELLAEIRHFFQVYKTLEPRKHAVAGDYLGRDAAWAEIQACRDRFRREETLRGGRSWRGGRQPPLPTGGDNRNAPSS